LGSPSTPNEIATGANPLPRFEIKRASTRIRRFRTRQTCPRPVFTAAV
jgi:hypothetical protein